MGNSPLGEVCRDADLWKGCMKGSKCLQESCRALDDLTAGQPQALTDLAGTHLKVCESESKHRDWAILSIQTREQKGSQVSVSGAADSCFPLSITRYNKLLSAVKL